MAVDQCDAARELADFGEELARSLVDHRRDVSEAIALGDRDMAREHDEHARSGLAGFEQHFAVPVSSDVAEPAHPRDFLRRQRGKGLFVTRECGGARRADIAAISDRGLRHLRLSGWSMSRKSRTGVSSRQTRSVCPEIMLKQKDRAGWRFVEKSSRSRAAAFFRCASCGEASSGLEGAGAVSLRPRACDLRRLRFSRSASFSRSWRACFFESPPVWPSRLSLSSLIVDPECDAA